MKTALADQVLPKRFLGEAHKIIAAHNARRLNHRDHVASFQTQQDRRATLLLCFAQLWKQGYRIQSPRALGERHIHVLTQHWREQGLAPATLQTRLSNLRAFCHWIDKPGLVKELAEYFPNGEAKRTTVAKSNRSWVARGVDAAGVIERARGIDERFAVCLSLQKNFGLRVKESIEFRPAHSLVEGGTAIEIYAGTKGGRLRRIPIETPEQAEAFEWAREVAATSRSGRLRWPDCSWRKAQRRFYRLLGRRLGINKRAAGVTAHGLRHQFSQQKYRRETGLPTPVEGGALGRIDRNLHEQASMHVSRALGHGRLAVTTSYYGSYGHALRATNFIYRWDHQDI